MSWLSKSLNSSIGKKIVMAATGLSLVIFLSVHFINNMFLFVSENGEEFNTLVHSLDAVKPIVRVAELILVFLFGYHFFNAFRLWLEQRKAKSQKYAFDGNKEVTTFSSRTMPYTGGIIFVFLLIHLGTLWVKYNFGMGGEHNYYDVIAETFSSLPIAIFYVIVMITLGFHLWHGFQSAFQTFGWHHKKYTPVVEFIGKLYAFVFAVGFSAIPIYFFIRSMGGN